MLARLLLRFLESLCKQVVVLVHQHPRLAPHHGHVGRKLATGQPKLVVEVGDLFLVSPHFLVDPAVHVGELIRKRLLKFFRRLHGRLVQTIGAGRELLMLLHRCLLVVLHSRLSRRQLGDHILQPFRQLAIQEGDVPLKLLSRGIAIRVDGENQLHHVLQLVGLLLRLQSLRHLILLPPMLPDIEVLVLHRGVSGRHGFGAERSG
mmetsp:Transcript_72323/g.172720  ORF Transcript_72323/g.172720 Transcript_72323/m.172720 type:complete len:205 (+) Transcript_72323:1705-2319(+)